MPGAAKVLNGSNTCYACRGCMEGWLADDSAGMEKKCPMCRSVVTAADLQEPTPPKPPSPEPESAPSEQPPSQQVQIFLVSFTCSCLFASWCLLRNEYITKKTFAVWEEIYSGVIFSMSSPEKKPAKYDLICPTAERCP